LSECQRAAQCDKLKFFYYICCFFLYFQAILSILKVAWQYLISSDSERQDWTCDVIEQVTIRLAIGHYLSIGNDLEQSLYLQPFSRLCGTNHIGVTTLTFQGHVTSSVTRPLDSRWVISYWWSFGPKSLSLTVSEIFHPKHHVLIDTMLNRHCACAISRDVYYLCKI